MIEYGGSSSLGHSSGFQDTASSSSVIEHGGASVATTDEQLQHMIDTTMVDVNEDFEWDEGALGDLVSILNTKSTVASSGTPSDSSAAAGGSSAAPTPGTTPPAIPPKPNLRVKRRSVAHSGGRQQTHLFRALFLASSP